VQITGLPAGVTVSPATSISVSASSPQTIAVSCASTVAPGPYSAVVTATSGSLSHTQSVAVTIQAPPNPDFALTLTPSSMPLASGTEGSFQVSMAASGGFSGAVQVQISGLPTGATVSPTGPYVLSSSQPLTFTVATANALTPGPYPLTVTATSGTLSHSVSESLTVVDFATVPSRADFVRTDDTPAGAVYDQVHKCVYVTNPIAGTVDVISSVTYQILRRIPVPSPAGIDISPDDSTVFIGTGTEVLYALDTATMAITARSIAPQGGTVPLAYYQAAPVATPDGSVLISAGGSVVKWNPATNQTTTVLTNAPVDFQYGPAQGPAAHSAGHTKVIQSNNLSTSTVYVYDETSNRFSAPLTFDGYAYAVAVNPAGTQFAVAWTDNNSVEWISFLDANLNTISKIQDGGSPLYSSDGKTLYLCAMFGQTPLIGLIDATTFTMTGTAPLYGSLEGNRAPPLTVAIPMATDETGRVFGSADHGLSIDDVTDVRTYSGSQIEPIYDLFAVPDGGPVGQQQAIEIETTDAPVTEIWFGPRAGSSTGTSRYLSVLSAMLNQTGPVNIRMEDPDNVQAWMPQAYTYGSVLSPGPDLAGPANGGASISLYGYGLGDNSALSIAAAGTTVTIGGAQGTISSESSLPNLPSYPFPLWYLTVKTPAVSAGEADITATTAWGAGTLHSMYHSLDIPSYALDGTPYSMAYDATRNKLYIAVTDHVDVFSLTSNSFTSTIQIPTLNHVKQLGGLALTPDGKSLIAANWGDGSVAIINPDSPSTATAVAVGAVPGPPYGQGPNELGATNTGLVFIGVGAPPNSISTAVAQKAGMAQSHPRPGTLSTTSTGPEAPVWILNLSSMTAAPFAPTNTAYYAPEISASPDGSEVCLAGEYLGTALYSSATATVKNAWLNENGFCAVGDSVVVGGGSGTGAAVANLAGQEVSSISLVDYQKSTLGEPIGLAMDNTGALLYLPYGDTIELFDTHTGEHRESISLPAPLDDLFDGPTAVDNTGGKIFVFTSNNLTIVQMDVLPLAIGSISASGSSWTIAGTGFLSGTMVSADGVPLAVQVTDAQHLEVSSAPGLTAVHLVTLTNPDGHSYTYDAAYLR
jgi:WD40 repeat protein